MEDQLLELLQEAYDQLREMWKVADDSVADYTLILEVAMRFSEKAFQTKDRLDIFRALQKAHDALEKDEVADDDEDDLVDRLALALNGGLNEIDFGQSQERPPESQRDILSRTDSNFYNISRGHRSAHKLLNLCIKNVKSIITFTIKSIITRKINHQEFMDINREMVMNCSRIMAFLMMWASNINKQSPNHFQDIDRIMKNMDNSFNQITPTTERVLESIMKQNELGKKNYINASKQLKDLNVVFDNIKQSIDDLFQIGIDIGFNKKK